jgi:hypothetical protein
MNAGERVNGAPMMMVSPTLSHQRIADNLTRLLNDALARHDPARIAVSAAGVELGEAALAWTGEDYRPEPDVLAMDAEFEPRQRFVERASVIASRVGYRQHAGALREGEGAVDRHQTVPLSRSSALRSRDPDRPLQRGLRADLRMAHGWTATGSRASANG